MLTLLLAALLFTTPAVAADPPVGTAEPASVDEARHIYERVERFHGIELAWDDGVVHLSGTVGSESARDQAVTVAARIDEALFVDDALDVDPLEGKGALPQVGKVLRDMRSSTETVIARLPLFVVAGIVLLLAVLLGRTLRNWDGPYRALADRPLLRQTVGRLVYAGVVVAGLVVALEILNATSLVGAVVGTAGVFGLAVGFAFQDIVENYLAGLLLAMQQPFSKNDLVEVGGVLGVVLKLNTRNTLLLTPEGNHVFLPNADVFKGTLLNYSRNPHRRFSFLVGVGVDEDLAEVFRVGLQTLGQMPGVADEPSPTIFVDSLGDSNVVVDVRGWVDQREHDYAAVRTEAIRRIKEAYDDAEFDMPEPIYRVQVTDRPPVQPKPKPTGAGTDTVVDLKPDRDLERQADAQRQAEGGSDLLTA